MDEHKELQTAAAADRSVAENKAILRSVTFGGFNKADVMDFVEKQKQTEAQLRMQINDLTAKLTEAQRQTEALTAQIDAEEAEKYRQEAQEKASALTLCEARLKSLQERFDALSEENSRLHNDSVSERDAGDKAQITTLTAALDAAAAEREALQAENEALQAQNTALADKLADAQQQLRPEGQVAAAIIDARRCADRMLAEAKAEEREIQRRTYETIRRAEASMESVYREIAVCVDRGNGVAESVKAELNALKTSFAAEAEKYHTSDA